MDYLYDDTTVYVILFIVAFFASLIDSIAGGGGLLTTPSMLLVGMPPLNVLATNKFQSCFGTFTSTFNYYKNGLLVEKKRVLYFVLAFTGSSIGTLLVSRISNETLESVIPILLISAAIFFITNKPCCRSDFIFIGDTPHFLELNSIPGLTAQSLLPMQAQHAGIGLGDLIVDMINSCLKNNTFGI